MKQFITIKQKLLSVLHRNTHPLADSPRDFSLTDWKLALAATKNAITSKHLGLLAAGIAYFATFAFFPLIAAGVATASLVISPKQINSVADAIQSFLPTDIATLITTQLETALKNPEANLIIAIAGILIAVFSISGAITNFMNALNISYERTESRSFVTLRLTSLFLLVSATIVGLIIGGLLVLRVDVLESIGIPTAISVAIILLRWLVITVLVALYLAIFYRYGPDRRQPKWQWVSWGSLLASISWLLVTALFFVYARYFAHFSDSYSIFAGIIVLMTWFNLSAFVLLLGAEINHRLEQQTFRKS